MSGEPEDGPIYIGGLDRSGKTTMRAFLASHPRIAIPAVGSNMWTYFYGQFGDLTDDGNLGRCLQAMLRYKHVRFLDPDGDRIRTEFVAGSRTYARLFSLFLIHYAEREGKPRWGAQTGLIERYADRLFAAYPGLRIVHMLRDPRDRYEASLALWPEGRGRAGGATARWLYSTSLAERHVRRYPGAYLIVRFEDLVNDTEKTLIRVCAFLGEEYTPDMLSMAAAPTLRSRLGVGEDPAPSRAPLSSDFVGCYRGRVPQPELAFMQLHTGRRMRTHGYRPDPIDMTAREWLRFATVDWPDQAARMMAWRGVEELQQRFPGRFGRKPGDRMIVGVPQEARR